MLQLNCPGSAPRDELGKRPSAATIAVIDQNQNMAMIKQHAATSIAIDLGLLFVCTRCGASRRTHGTTVVETNYCSFAPFDPFLPLFRGDVDELLTAVEAAVTRHCITCECGGQ